MLPRAIYTFNAIPIKMPWTFFRDWNKICVESEKTPNSQGNIEKENHSWRHHNAGFQVVLQSCDHQDSMVLAQNRHIDQWSRIVNPEMGPQLYSQLIFNKAGKTIHWKKESLH